jgi:twinkle protein
VNHGPCEACGSSDANATYSDGHAYCFSCEAYTPPQEGGTYTQELKKISTTKLTPVPTDFKGIADRSITKATVAKYGVTVMGDDNHVYPYFDTDKHHQANKVRYPGKTFNIEGAWPKTTMFGQQLFEPGEAKQITIVEGELDALAAYQMLGSRFPVVSVRTGAKSSKNDIAANFEYLNAFETIVICFDKDEPHFKPDGSTYYPGQDAAKEVANMFEPGKVRLFTPRDFKDACDYLAAGQGAAFSKQWWQAPVVQPDGLKLGRDMWEEISAPKNFETVAYPWSGLDKMTYGIRLSEFVVVTAETGIGKTSILKEIEHYLLKNTTRGIGLLHLEEPNSDTALGLMSITANKPLHLPDVRAEVNSDELRGYFDSTIDTDRVVIWDHFGSNSIYEILAKVRHMHNLGCKYIVLDHLSIVVSDQSGDERKQLDEISTKLKTLCMELNIAVIAVIHQNRSGQIRGTAGVEQLANIVFKLYRDKTDIDQWRRNVTKIVVEKNRFSGKTGPACWLWYDEATGRLVELDDAEVQAYESGGKVTVDEQW